MALRYAILAIEDEAVAGSGALRLHEALQKHRPTLYPDDPVAPIHCKCGLSDHMAGWYAHLIVEVIELALAASPAAGEEPVRAMYGRLAAAHRDRPEVPDRGGGVTGDKYPLNAAPESSGLDVERLARALPRPCQCRHAPQHHYPKCSVYRCDCLGITPSPETREKAAAIALAYASEGVQP